MRENILIVYYSYSGKTRRIAEEIQKQTGGEGQMPGNGHEEQPVCIGKQR